MAEKARPCADENCIRRNYSKHSNFCKHHRTIYVEEEDLDPSLPFGWAGQGGRLVPNYEPCSLQGGRCIRHAVCTKEVSYE